MRFHLPSGAIFDSYAAGEPWSVAGLFAEEAARIRGTVTSKDGVAVRVDDLSLRDFHTVRAIARRLGIVEEAFVTVVCDNCGASFDVRPSATLELAPYRDNECDDVELDGPFDFAEEHVVQDTEEGSGDSESQTRVVFAPRSVGQTAALRVALCRPRWRFTSDAVRSMGVVSLNGLTDERRIARRLEAGSEPSIDALVELFERAHYPARLDTPHACPRCEAVAWVPCPAEREFSLPTRPGERTASEDAGPSTAFMTIEEFERLVRQLADVAYAEMGIRNVGLLVSEAPAACDAGGTPLLGGYMPGDPDAAIPSRPEVTLYYRTFASMWRDEGPFDVRYEVDETIRHELEHHLAYLAGDDPMDEEERAILADEYRRRIGRREAARRELRDGLRSLRDFLRATWWLWLLALAGGWAMASGVHF